MSSDEKPILTCDIKLTFPEFIFLRASAGSGKTHALSLRFVQFLLSDEIKTKLKTGTGGAARADLPNILAITFTKNAAHEMKDRILDWLKGGYFGDPEKIRQILDIVSVPLPELPARAAAAVERILSSYTDFQVQTIDSFMASIYDASTLDLGASPDYEIVMDNREVIDYAFQRYLRRVGPSSEEGRVFKDVIKSMLDNLRADGSYIWDPAEPVLKNLKILYARLSAQTGDLFLEDHKEHTAEKLKLKKAAKQKAARLVELVKRSGLEPKKNGHYFTRIIPAVRDNRDLDLIRLSFKTEPVKKPENPKSALVFKKIIDRWSELDGISRKFRALYARDFFYPYGRVFLSLEETLEDVKKRLGTVFMEDIHKKLSRHIRQGIVPDVYFRLGEQIFHYLIDEFQDTSPIQWANLMPLIDNSLSLGGSLFLVGDMKQAIYGFRDADYRIQKKLEDPSEHPFGSTDVQPKLLDKNRRSHQSVFEFIKKIFPEAVARREEYRKAAARSGLDEINQSVIEQNLGSGYATYVRLERDEENLPEKTEIQERVLELLGRGYRYSDIAILTYKNESVVNISAWLNEIPWEGRPIPIIPYSSLDIRRRKITGEILAFLRFLDSPPDDLSFAAFLLGDVLAGMLADEKSGSGPELWIERFRSWIFSCRERREPLYASFRKEHPRPWQQYFEPFFKTVGYSPLYDLVTQFYRVFGVFERFADEEASLAKFLEAIKDFEGAGRNDLREFLVSAERKESGESNLDIDVPVNIDALKIMSIHKAKGLGFPVVILLLYGEKYRAQDFYLDADKEHVRILKLNQDLIEADSELKDIYDNARESDLVDRLNTLYVALTRAGRELHVIGVKGDKDTYPFDLFEDVSKETFGKKLKVGGRAGEKEPPSFRGVRFRTAVERIPGAPESLNTLNIQRGDIIHGILAAVSTIQNTWEVDLAEVIQKLEIPESERPLYDESRAAIVRFFAEPALSRFFQPQPGRSIFTEYEVCDARGQVLRLDRMIVDPEEVTIVDFKTGVQPDPVKKADWEKADAAQMLNYIRIVKDIYPEMRVSGYLAYIDQGRWERLE
jgi:ATP-dependent helicase/nuclease subunit A